jgi:hypothetical protein
MIPSVMVWPLALAACGASALPAPPYAKQPSTALVAVPFPPPPARVEAVPARPDKNAAWVDGEWAWRARRWLWLPGRWVVAPKAARYSPWTVTRAADGTVLVAPGAWRDARGEVIAPPPPLAVAAVSPGAVVDVEGDILQPGRTLAPPGGRER